MIHAARQQTTAPCAKAAIIAAVLSLGSALAFADTISLKRTAELKPESPVLLAHIADLEGARAIRLGETVIAESPADLPRVRAASETMPAQHRADLDTIRAALETAPEINWAFLTVRGRDVLITLPSPEIVTIATEPDAPASAETTPQGLSEVPEGSIGAFARDVVRTILRVEDDDLRIVWPDRHREFLTEQVAGRTLHVQPIGTSDRMPLSFTIYDGDRIVRTEAVRAEISVRRTVRTLAKPMHRGTLISPADFTTRSAWVGPGVDPATVVANQISARRLEAGVIIEADDITPPFVIERGELITLHCVSGAVAIRSPARALQDARDGETVQVEMEGTERRVLARANGRGNAVLVVRTNPVERIHASEKGTQP